jgi:hypothetical protein
MLISGNLILIADLISNELLRFTATILKAVPSLLERFSFAIQHFTRVLPQFLFLNSRFSFELQSYHFTFSSTHVGMINIQTRFRQPKGDN